MLLARTAPLAALLLLVACTDRTLDSASDASGTSGASSGAPPVTSADPTTAPPTTTFGSDSAPTTTTGPTVTSTTAVSTTTDATTVDVTTVDATTSGHDSGQPKLDLPAPPVEAPKGLQGCTMVAPAGTDVNGQTALGAFKGTRALFGEVNINGWIGGLRLLILDDAADAEAVLQELEQTGSLQTGPAALIEPDLEFTQEGKWTGETIAGAQLLVGGEFTFVEVTLEVAAHPGDWDAVDPADPPRVAGSFASNEAGEFLAGEFDAVYCDRLRLQVIAE